MITKAIDLMISCHSTTMNMEREDRTEENVIGLASPATTPRNYVSRLRYGLNNMPLDQMTYSITDFIQLIHRSPGVLSALTFFEMGRFQDEHLESDEGNRRIIGSKRCYDGSLSIRSHDFRYSARGFSSASEALSSLLVLYLRCRVSGSSKMALSSPKRNVLDESPTIGYTSSFESSPDSIPLTTVSWPPSASSSYTKPEFEEDCAESPKSPSVASGEAFTEIDILAMLWTMESFINAHLSSSRRILSNYYGYLGFYDRNQKEKIDHCRCSRLFAKLRRRISCAQREVLERCNWNVWVGTEERDIAAKILFGGNLLHNDIMNNLLHSIKCVCETCCSM